MEITKQSPPQLPDSASAPGREPPVADAAILLQATQMVAAASTSGKALGALYACLKAHYGLRALALEVVSGTATRLQAYGEKNLFQEAGAEEARLHICPLQDRYAPPGRILYALPPQTSLPPGLPEAITAQVAMRLGQERLIQRAEEAEIKARQRISEVGAIYEIGQAIDQIELPRLLPMITERAAHLMDAQACSLMLVDEEAQVLRVRASHGLPEDALEQDQQIGEGLAGLVAQTEQPLLITGISEDPRLEGVTLRPEISSSMLVPMKSREGKALGVMSIRRRAPAPDFTEDDLKLFSVFSTQATLALTNVQLYADLKQRAAELVKISSLSRVLISTIDLDELLGRVADDVCQVVGFKRCSLFVRDLRKPLYVPRVWRGYSDLLLRHPVREGEGVIGLTASGKEALIFNAHDPVPAGQERQHMQLRGFARSLGADAFIAIPILTGQDRCIGVLVADNKGRRNAITPEQKSLLSAFVNQAGIAIENARLYKEMQENLHNLHRLKAYTENVLQSIGAGIVSTDWQGRIVRWNRAAEETLGQQPNYFRNSLLSELIERICLPDTEQNLLLSLIAQVLETGERVHRHKLTLHPEGREPMTLNLMLSRLTDHNQERAGVVLIFEDVTQEVHLEAELEKMRRLADIGQLAAKMAHEVRNALSPIKGAAQILRGETEAQGTTTEWSDIILAEVDGLSRLTSEMLNFARSTPLNPRPLILNSFLMGAVQSLAAFLAEHRVLVEWKLAADLPKVLADPIQLGQAVRNIVMNAAQSMSEGGMLQIDTEYDPQDCQLQIRFRDTGVGIPPDELERIFRPFVTTKTKGTGPGLPIVQKIVAQHGGRVEVTSQVGAGTCFTVLLPLSPPSDLTDLGEEETPIISAQLTSPIPDN